MNKCIKCNLVKAVDSFAAGKKGTRRNICKLCRNIYQQQYYKENAAIHIARVGKRNKTIRQKHAALIDAYKRKPCLDCKQIFPTYVMDFDHVRGEKKYLVSKLRSWHYVNEETIKTEIEKCDIVCANCHRIRTQQRLEKI